MLMQRESFGNWLDARFSLASFEMKKGNSMSEQSSKDDGLGFAPEHDLPVPYMKRLRDYYLALGYGNPYRWAQYKDVPYTPMTKPVSQTKVGLVVTAAPYQPGKGDQGPGAPYNAAAKFYRVYTDTIEGEPDVLVSHIGIDRKHTTAADVNSYFPLAQLKIAAEEGRIGELSNRFIGTPTNRSQVVTIEQDCADVLAELRKDGVEAAVIVAA
jgi:D-proline reductase (dithiol) PrdB